MKIAAILIDTVRELVYRRTLVVYTAIVTLVLLLFALALRTDIAGGAIASLTILGQEGRPAPGGFRIGGPPGPEGALLTAEAFVRWVQFGASLALYGLGVMLSTFATAGLVPRMLERGTIDLLLSKPIGRTRLFLARWLGGLLAASVNLVYMVAGLGIILAFKTGVWNGGFFASALVMVLYFACLLSWIVLLGILFRSAAVSTMLAAMIVVASLLVRPAHERRDWLYLLGPGGRAAARAAVEGLYHLFPRTWDFGRMAFALIVERGTIDGPAVLGSALSGAGALALAAWLFHRRDF
ncbi:MAG: ABC transporter permease subunit [Candidatus Polarisedimenticolia bacterium]